MPFCGTFQKLRPLSLLTHLSSCYDSAHLRIFSNSVSWSIYLDQGKLLYALHSVEPFERLERHLHRLMPQIPDLDSETWMQLRHVFKAASESQSTFSKEEPPKSESTSSILPPDYQAICWLVSQKYMNLAQAATLVEELATEVIESLLLVQSGTYALETQRNTKPPVLCRLELQPLVENCQQRLQSGQSLGSQKTVGSDTSTQSQQLVQNIVLPSSKTAADDTDTSLDDGIAVDHKLPQRFVGGSSNDAPFAARLSAKSEVFQALAPTSTTSRQGSRRFPTRLLLIGIGIALGLTAFISRLYPYIRLNEIRTLKAEGRYKECITTAATAVQNPILSKKARGLLNECLMSRAEQLATEGKLKEAIAAVRKIPANSPLYPRAQKHLREWDEI
ncbi:MAG: DUF4388 domain-containing protein [Chroococcidiopsidaceae cyanobacterium CP_BM_ER_R8_30]|nr:DUF4388 domain-containing protein [Chroococcidiopsidaceae cyanobacterium CP_BM_ER_R8_30]